MKIPFFVSIVHMAVVAAAIYIQPAPLKTAPRKSVKVKTIVISKDQFQVAHVQQKPASSPPAACKDVIPPPVVEPEEEVEEPAPPTAKEPEPVAARRASPPPVRPQPKKGVTQPAPPTPKPHPTPPLEPNPTVAPLPPHPTASKNESKKKSASPKKPSSTVSQKKPAASNPNRDKLISMMEKSLNTIENTGSGKVSKSGEQKGSKGSSSSIGVIGTLASESLTFEAQYEEELVPYLQAILSLPVRGEVKIKLTLKREGSVQKMEVIKASSSQNRAYVEKMIADLSFPPFGTHFKGEASHTFTINLESVL